MRLVVLQEYLLCLFGEHLDLREGDVFGDDFLHLVLDRVDLLIGDKMDLCPAILHLSDLMELTVQSARQGVVHD